MEGVALGMPGPWADNNHEAADHYTTKIGGVPDWPLPILSVKPVDILECKGCQSCLCLIAQVYAPVSNNNSAIEERVIYVFGCVTSRCESVTWRAIRVQKNSSLPESTNVSNEVVNVNESVSVSNSDWLSDGSDDDIDLQELGKALFEAANVASTGKKQPTNTISSKKPSINDQPARSIDDKVPVLPCFYTYIQEEKPLKKVTSESSKDTLLSAKESENSSEEDSNGETYDEESYEYDKALNADRTYLKFKKRIDAYPEQCFRYSYGGRPLLPSGEAGDPGNCSLCGEPRHSEMQLMPPVIYFLQEVADDQQKSFLEKFDWMSLLVYTCSKSCANISNDGSDESWTVAEEAVIVQYE